MSNSTTEAELQPVSKLMLGGWSPYTKPTTADLVVFEEAMKGFVGATYTPEQVSTQVVAGMNYKFICKVQLSTVEPIQYQATVQVFAPLNGGTPVISHIIPSENPVVPPSMPIESQVLKPLPTYNDVRPHSVLCFNYYVLYNHYFFGVPLPADFPQSIIKQFPNKSYKRQLKEAINKETAIINDLEGIQKEYLADYYALYGHYANGVILPADFPNQILKQFPSKNYKQQLKAAISALQNEINNENLKP